MEAGRLSALVPLKNACSGGCKCGQGSSVGKDLVKSFPPEAFRITSKPQASHQVVGGCR